MPKVRLTDLGIARLKPPAEGRIDLWDALLPAFGLRISASGRRTWIVAVRKPGSFNSSRLSLGTWPEMSLGEARTAARALLADPTGAIAERQRAKAATVATVLADYIARDQKPRRRAWQSVERVLQRELAPLADRPVSEVRRRDIVTMVNRVTDRGSPAMARRVHAHVRRMLAWAVGQGHLETSPAAGTEAPAAGASRTRVLSPAELAAVWRAAGLTGWPSGPIVKLLTLTGQRRGEVAGAAWAEIDLAAGLWTLPASRTKAAREHLVPLAPLAISILRQLPNFGGPLVFPGRNGPVQTIGKAKLDALSGVRDWRLHDLRRTVASGIARLGHPPHVVGAVLNHAVRGVTGVYNRHDYLPEKREALNAWASEVERLVAR